MKDAKFMQVRGGFHIYGQSWVNSGIELKDKLSTLLHGVEASTLEEVTDVVFIPLRTIYYSGVNKRWC